MFKSPVDAAIAASLSLLLEVSGNPKAGNVDREHDLEDLKYEHFIASSVGAFPAFLMVAEKGKIGEGVFLAVKESMRWHKAENVHFGAFLLLIPLIASWREAGMRRIAERAVGMLKNTGYEDSLRVLEAFKMCGARVVRAEKLNLQNEKTEKDIREKKINLYEWMKMAPEENLIAKELVEGYKISLYGADFILNSKMDVNATITALYHDLLSKYPDPLIMAKKGRDYALKVVEWAKSANGNLEKLRELDERLIRDDANPGTIADLTASSIYLAISEGWRI
jgi:triphosphoribosyl-dephospho-CoA synthase